MKTIRKYEVILVRHGQSIWNHDSKFTGWTNIPLTDLGRKEAKIISKVIKENKLKPNVLFSSVLNRCIETANILKDNLKIESPIYTSWRLNEKHYGTLEGMPRDYIRNEYGKKFTEMMRNNFYMKPPVIGNLPEINEKYPIFKNCYFDKIKNGESKENVLNRLLPYFENDILYSFTENKIPLIVTHKHCIRVLMKHYLKMTDEEFEKYNIPSESILRIKFDKKLNYKEHEFMSYK